MSDKLYLNNIDQVVFDIDHGECIKLVKEVGILESGLFLDGDKGMKKGFSFHTPLYHVDMVQTYYTHGKINYSVKLIGDFTNVDSRLKPLLDIISTKEANDVVFNNGKLPSPKNVEASRHLYLKDKVLEGMKKDTIFFQECMEDISNELLKSNKNSTIYKWLMITTGSHEDALLMIPMFRLLSYASIKRYDIPEAYAGLNLN